MDWQKENEQLKQEIEILREALKKAEQKIKELTELLGQNSRNSSWPASRDKGRRKKRSTSLRQKSGKKAGGQEGHPGETLERSEKPDEIQVHRPEKCEKCQTRFSEAQRRIAVDRRQVYDLPPMRLIVSEHQAETLECSHCGQWTQGEFPEDVKAPVQYGPGVQQLAVYLKTEQLIPYERSRQFFADLFGVQLSPGTLQNSMERAARRVKPIVEKIKEGLVTSPVGHFDESGFYVMGQRYWLHTAGTTNLTYYFSHCHRGHKATEAMAILPRFQGTAVHDAWSAYRHYTECSHGLCNAHHLRELTAVLENDNQHWAALCKRFLLSAKAVVHAAQQAGSSALPQAKIDQIERIYARLISAGLSANPPPPDGWPKSRRGRVKKTKTRNFVERLDERRAEVLAFVYDFQVPFDNNLAERDIRMLKVQQKISGCFRSTSAAQDFCLIRSYISTIRKQGLSVWLALRSLFSDKPLLPAFSPV